MSYQAVVRNASNTLVTGSPGRHAHQRIARFPHGHGRIYGNPYAQYQRQRKSVSLEIGGGVAVSGSFPAIDWANGPYFIQTETDPTGGTNYTITGTGAQFLSVPMPLRRNRLPPPVRSFAAPRERQVPSAKARTRYG